jgi:hypothetical protein
MTEERCVETDCNGDAYSQARCVGDRSQAWLTYYVTRLGMAEVR